MSLLLVELLQLALGRPIWLFFFFFKSVQAIIFSPNAPTIGYILRKIPTSLGLLFLNHCHAVVFFNN